MDLGRPDKSSPPLLPTYLDSWWLGELFNSEKNSLRTLVLAKSGEWEVDVGSEKSGGEVPPDAPPVEPVEDMEKVLFLPPPPPPPFDAWLLVLWSLEDCLRIGVLEEAELMEMDLLWLVIEQEVGEEESCWPPFSLLFLFFRFFFFFLVSSSASGAWAKGVQSKSFLRCPFPHLHPQAL